MLIVANNLSTPEAEAGELGVSSQLGLQRKNLSPIYKYTT